MIEELSNWKASTRVTLWSVVAIGVMSLLSILAPVLGGWSLFGAYQDYSSFSGSDDSMKTGVIILFVVRFLLLFGYAGYVWGLTRFVDAQTDWRDQRPVRQVRSGVILLSVSIVMGLLVALQEGISLNLFLAIVCGWVIDLVALIIMKDGFRQMRYSENYLPEMQRGARNLQSAATFNIALLLTPLFVYLAIVLFGLLIYTMAMSSTTRTVTHYSSTGAVETYTQQIGSMASNLEGASQAIASVTTIFLAIGLVLGLLFMLLSLLLPIVGWYRMMKGGLVGGLAETAVEPVGSDHQEPEIEQEEKEPSQWLERLKDRRFWLYAAGTLVAVAAILGLVSLFGGGRNNPLGIEHPAWERFVVVTDPNTRFHKAPSADSPTLMWAMENMESDVAACEYRWSDQGRKRGFSVNDYEASSFTVYPVESEENGWLKLFVSNDMYGSTTAYVEKDVCREVKPAKLTPEIFDQIDGQGFCRHYILQSGELCDVCFLSQFEDMDGEHVTMGQVFDDCLVFPWAKCYISANQNYNINDVQLNGKDGYYLLNYGGQYCYSQQGDGYSMTVLDTRKLPADMVQHLYELMKNDHPQYFTAYYYFPDVEEGHYFTFNYSAEKTHGQAAGEDGEEVPHVTGFRSMSVGDEYELQAEFYGEAYDDTGIRSFCPIDVLLTDDLDGDGHVDAIVQEFCGGNAAEPIPYIVCFDPVADTFKSTDGFNTWREVKVEEKDGRKTMVQQEGIKSMRYVLENQELKLVETDVYDVGRTLKAWTREQLFPEENEMSEDVYVSFDIDGDGTDEQLCFSHDTSHPFMWGAYMSLYKIVWADGRESDYSGIYISDRIAVVESMTNGMHDILTGESFFQRWDGSHYMEWTWNGKKLEPIANEE